MHGPAMHTVLWGGVPAAAMGPGFPAADTALRGCHGHPRPGQTTPRFSENPTLAFVCLSENHRPWETCIFQLWFFCLVFCPVIKGGESPSDALQEEFGK